MNQYKYLAKVLPIYTVDYIQLMIYITLASNSTVPKPQKKFKLITNVSGGRLTGWTYHSHIQLFLCWYLTVIMAML